jgi:glycosyltransferase involved in cell wall biosynthesis
MKVLMINSFDRWGGTEIMIHDLTKGLRSSGVEVEMWVGEKFTEDSGIKAFPKQWPDKAFQAADAVLGKLGSEISSKRALSISSQWNHTYEKLSVSDFYQEADVIHLHNLHSNNGYFDLDAIRSIAAEKKVIWTLHDQWAMTGGEAYTFDHDGYKTGDAQTPYGDIYPQTSMLLDKRKEYMALKKEIYAATRITFVANSKWTETTMRSAWVKPDVLDLHTIRNGVDTNRFFDQNSRNWSTPRILLIDSDSPFKGTAEAKKAIEGVDAEHELTISAAGKSRSEMAKLYNSHDILLFPSKAESFGLVVAEAKACGMCVIGSDLGGIQEQLENGFGVLVPSGNTNAWRSAITSACEDLNGTRSIGKIASADVRDHYDLRTMTDNYIELYRLSAAAV